MCRRAARRFEFRTTAPTGRPESSAVSLRSNASFRTATLAADFRPARLSLKKGTVTLTVVATTVAIAFETSLRRSVSSPDSLTGVDLCQLSLRTTEVRTPRRLPERPAIAIMSVIRTTRSMSDESLHDGLLTTWPSVPQRVTEAAWPDKRLRPHAHQWIAFNSLVPDDSPRFPAVRSA